MEAEKKKFAAAKKFKDAGKCQQEMKELASRKEFLTSQVEKTKAHKQQIDDDLKE